MTRSIREEVLEVIREIPGITTAQVADYMSHVRRDTVAAVVNHLYHRGQLLREKVANTAELNGRVAKRHTVWAYTINPEPKPPVITTRVAKQPKKKPDATSLTTSLQLKVEALQAQVNELEMWRMDAIERYPELAVDPVVLEARKIAAELAAESGDHNAAREIMGGRRDNTLVMKATITALSRVV